MNRALAKETDPEGTFDDNKFRVVLDAMTRAKLIIVTHEHPDHIGGIARHPERDRLLAKTLIAAEALENPEALEKLGFSAESLRSYRPARYTDYLRVAPGVVLIKARGHAPGNQMVYARLANGREYLFVGDVVWSELNLDRARGRPRLVTTFFIKTENRAVVYDQTRALIELRQANPGLILVVAHDATEHDRLKARGMLVEGLHLAP